MAEEETQQEPELTAEEVEEQIAQLVGTAPQSQGIQNVHSFLRAVGKAKDTTKFGNLTAEEVGLPKLPTRTYKELALFCEKVGNMPYYNQYFLAKSEIMTSTSLSKDALLIKLAVVIRKEIADATRTKPTENKGWFKRKKKGVEM